MRLVRPTLLLLVVAGVAAPVPVATAAEAVRGTLLSKQERAGGIVVRKERVTIGSRTSLVTTVTMPKPGRGHALEPYLPNDEVSEGTATTSSVSGALNRYGTAVAVNADLFEYASGQPSGLLVIDGEIYNQPQGGRPALSVDYRGNLTASRPKASGVLSLPRGREVPFEVNVRRRDGVVLYDNGWGPRIPEGAGRSLVGRLTAGSVVQHRQRWVASGALRAASSRRGGHAIPSDDGPDLLFAGYGSAASRLAVKPGAAFSMRYSIGPLARSARFAVGGGPILVRGGKLIYRRASNREFSDSQLMPPDARTAVAQLDDGRVVFYAVDQVAGSDGFTVGEVARDLHRRGARTAMAFDSGGSTAISLNGRLLNRPSDGYERPVGNMLVFFRPDEAHRKPIGWVRVRRPRPGGVVPRVTYAMVKPGHVEIALTSPKGRVVYLEDRRRDVGTHHVRLPAKMRKGEWELEVAVPSFQDRVVKQIQIVDRPEPTPKVDVELDAAEAPEPSAAAPAEPTRAAGADAGAAPWGWVAMGAAILAGAGLALALLRRRAR